MQNPTVVITGKRHVHIEDRPVPQPGPGEVLIKTFRSLISTGTEMNLYKGEAQPGSVWSEMSSYPKLTGYSNVGEVMAVGENVSKAWIGLMVHNHGKHQAYTSAPAEKLAAVPQGVKMEDATFGSLAKVAMNGLRRGNLTWGDRKSVV